MRNSPAMSRRTGAMISTLLLLLLGAAAVAQRSQAKDGPQTAAETAPEPVQDNLGVDREELLPSPETTGAVVFDEHAPASPAWLTNLFCPLPARVEMLSSDAPDAAETDKLRALRESYEELLKEKAALLNADALSAEIELQRRQVTELQALKELRKLEQSLKELSDKFPDSEAGKRAREVLNQLKNNQDPAMFREQPILPRRRGSQPVKPVPVP